MDKVLEIYKWIEGQGSLFMALFAISEIIGELPWLKDSSVFGAIRRVLLWLKNKFPKKS